MKRVLFSILSTTFISSACFSQKLVTEFWENGQKRQEGISHSSIQPPKTTTSEMRVGDHNNSLRDGKWNFWYKNGQVQAEEYYKMGVEVGIWKTWYENGLLSSEVNYDSGKIVRYYQDGQKHSEGNILQGNIPDGKWTGWFENGKRNYEGNYKNGQKDGQWVWYNDKEEITLKEEYREGAKIE